MNVLYFITLIPQSGLNARNTVRFMRLWREAVRKLAVFAFLYTVFYSASLIYAPTRARN